MRANHLLSLLTGLALILALLSGCGDSSGTSGESPPASDPPSQEQPNDTDTTEQPTGNAEATSGESIQTNGGEVIPLSALEHQDAASDTAVYYTSDISPEAMVAIYDTPGAEVTLRKRAPLGDPIEVTLRGYELTLRKAEAACVQTEVTA